MNTDPDFAITPLADRLEQLFVKHGSERELSDGDVLYDEGSSPEEVHLVREGCIVLSAGGPGRRRHIADKRAGELVGESAALDRGPRTVSALAHGDAVVLTIRSTRFRRELQSDPALCYEFAVQLSRLLRTAATRSPN